MKNRFQNLPFKCNLQRYIADEEDPLKEELLDEVGAVQVDP